MWSFPSPARSNPAKKAVSANVTLPAPTAGWYVGQNVADAPPQSAYILDNWFPKEDSVDLRGGADEHCTGMTGDVESLMTYQTGTAAASFAGNNGSIYDVTGATASSVASGFSSNKWSYVQFTTTGGTFLRAVNGSDTPQIYNGTAWGTVPAITGPTPSTLSYVWAYKNRLYFIQKNSMSVWYLDIDSIGGAATELALGGVFNLGGALVAGGTWSMNTGTGLTEYVYFITDQGQVAIYSGLYPGDTATWTKVGIYDIAKPLGRFCSMKAGGDSVILTEDGMVPLSMVPSLDQIALASQAVTKNIAPEWRRKVQSRGISDEWSVCVWPKQAMVIITIPQAAGEDNQQFVANARTGAWCRFVNWDALCFTVRSNRLFYGTSDGRVMEGYSGGQDDGSIYNGTMLWSYDNLKRGPAQKKVESARLLFSTTKNVAVQLDILTDFDSTLPTPPSAIPDASGSALWDVALWDVDVWPGTMLASETVQNWESVDGIGATIAPLFQATMDSVDMADLRVYQIDLIYQSGQPLG